MFAIVRTGGKQYWTLTWDQAWEKQQDIGNLYEYPTKSDLVVPYMDLDKKHTGDQERWDDPQ